MPATSADTLRKSFARGDLGGVFFFHGDEEYLKEEAIDALIRAHLDPATRDFNLDQLRATSLDPETLASIAQTPPMMAEWRVVVVREAHALAANAQSRALLDSLTERRVPGLALVFSAQISTRPKPRTWAQLEKKAKTVVFNALAPGDLPDWLIEKTSESGVTLDPDAARALAAAAGSELGRLVQEIAKLCDFVGDRKRIEVDDVRKLVGHVPSQNRWDWFDLVGEAKFAEARAALDTLLETESGVGVVIGLGTHLLRVGIACAGGERALQGALAGHQQWLASRLARQARRWSAPAIDAALEDLLRADRLLKSTGLADHQVLEEWLLRCQVRQAAA